MNDAAQRLLLHTIAENPGNIEVTDKDKLIAKVGVTVDGMWQKKGHFSKIGVVFVISTGISEVLDYDFVVCFAMNPLVIMQEKVMMTLIIGITNIKSFAK